MADEVVGDGAQLSFKGVSDGMGADRHRGHRITSAARSGTHRTV
jgi:hypothetical protein